MASKGFTLVEMLVVLAIMALIVAIVPPFLGGGHSRAELAATARAIEAALRETRSRAIRQGRSEAFIIDAASGSYRGGDKDRTRHVPNGIRLSLFTAADGPPAGSDGGDAASERKPGDAPPALRFFADGSSTGGGVHLRQGTRRSDIVVDWLTGRVSLLDAGREATR
jgi:general secretion pathway protein H